MEGFLEYFIWNIIETNIPKKLCSTLLKNKLAFAPRRTFNSDGDFGETLILISGVFEDLIRKPKQSNMLLDIPNVRTICNIWWKFWN